MNTPEDFRNVKTILHSHAIRLGHIAQILSPTTLFLSNVLNFGEEEESAEQFDKTVQSSLRRILRSANAFAEDIGDKWKERSLPITLHHAILTLTNRIERHLAPDIESSIGVETLVVDVEDCLSELEAHGTRRVNKTLLRNLRGDCRDFIGIIRTRDTRHCVLQLQDLQGQTDSLLEFLQSKEREREEFRVVTVEDLILDAIDIQRPFAEARGISFRRAGHSRVRVSARRGDTVRALSNLINNAVKYSYLMKNGTAWVKISCEHLDAKATVTVENWGIPIPNEEIESVVQVGVRGSYAGLSGFSGHGIGLADASLVAEEHGTPLIIKSRPADHSELEPDYSKPFITEVSMSFPIY